MTTPVTRSSLGLFATRRSGFRAPSHPPNFSMHHERTPAPRGCSICLRWLSERASSTDYRALGPRFSENRIARGWPFGVNSYRSAGVPWFTDCAPTDTMKVKACPR
jgi:hypothetical protein